MNHNDKYLEATPHAKWVLFALLNIILVVGIYAYHQHESISALEVTTKEQIEENIIQLQKLIKYTTVFGLIVGLVFSPYFFWLGYRTLKCGEYPPPNSRVAFRTRVVTGKKARINGIALFVIALFMWFGFAVGLWIDYLMTRLL